MNVPQDRKMRDRQDMDLLVYMYWGVGRCILTVWRDFCVMRVRICAVPKTCGDNLCLDQVCITEWTYYILHVWDENDVVFVFIRLKCLRISVLEFTNIYSSGDSISPELELPRIITSVNSAVLSKNEPFRLQINMFFK